MFHLCLTQWKNNFLRPFKQTSGNFLFTIYLLLISFVAVAQTPVRVTSSAGSGAAGLLYGNLGAAFTAINNGTHTGVISVEINGNTSESVPAVLNGTGAGAASYTAISIRPTIDAVEVRGNFTTAGRGIIELNGADQVTIDGDNPLTAGTQRNLILTFTTNQTAAQSLIRLVTSALPINCNNVTIQNCELRGNLLNGNTSTVQSATSPAALSLGVVVAGGGSTVSATAAPAALATTGVAVLATIGSTANNFTLHNCSINNVGVGINFNGANGSSCNQMTITNNTIGSDNSGYNFPGGPSNTVYFKGIYFRGVTAATISNNLLQGISSYIISGGTPNVVSAIECTNTFNTGGGLFTITNNQIKGVWCNNSSTVLTTTQIARGIMFTGTTANTTLNIHANTVSNIRSNTISSATTIGAVAMDLGCNSTNSTAVVSNNDIHTIYSAQGRGAVGVSFSTGGPNGHVYNNRIRNIGSGAASVSAFSINAGIRLSAGTNLKVYHNSILLNHAYGNFQHLSACILSLANSAPANIDIRNNILANYSTTNQNATSADACLILNAGLTNVNRYTINNNAYFGPVSTVNNYLAYLYNTSAFQNPSATNTYSLADFAPTGGLTANNFRSFSSTLLPAATNDNVSFATRLANALPFASNDDLHIHSAFSSNANGTKLESGAATGLTVNGIGLGMDMDAVARMLPAMSTNGGGLSPDLGADEFDGYLYVRSCDQAPIPGIITATGVDHYCNGAGVPTNRQFTLSNYTDDITSIVLQWEASTTSATAGFAPINGATSDVYITNEAPTQTTWYRVAVMCTATGAVSYQDVPAATYFDAPPVAAFTSNGNPAAFCKKVGTQLQLTVTSEAATHYVWTGEGVDGADTDSSIIPDLTAYAGGTAMYTVTPYIGTCAGTTLNTTVNVFARPTLYNLTGGGTICSNGGTSIIGVANSEFGVTYELFKDDVSTGITVVRNAVGAFDFPIAQTQTGAYTVKAYFTNPALNGPCEAVIMNDTVRIVYANQWIGGNGNWSDPANWTCGVPQQEDQIEITSGVPQLDIDYIMDGSLQISANGALRILPNVTLTIGSTGVANWNGRPVTIVSNILGTGSLGKVQGVLTGATNVTVERYIPAHASRAWRLLSVPTYGNGQTIRQAWQEGTVNPNPRDNNNIFGTQITAPGSLAAVTAAGFDINTPQPSLYRYEADEWIAQTTTHSSIETKSGYFMYIRGNRGVGVSSAVTNNNTTATLRTTGSLYIGTHVSNSIAPNTFGLVGNIYPSAIDFEALTRDAGIGNAFYTWDAQKLSGSSLGMIQTFSATNGYECLLPGGSYAAGAANTSIQSGQAFFVRAYSEAGNITFNENCKVSGNLHQGFRPASTLSRLKTTLLRVLPSGQDIVDVNAIVFDDNYADTYGAEDAYKFENNRENFAIKVDHEPVTIEGRSWMEGSDTTDFTWWSVYTGTYRLRFEPQLMNVEGLTAYLVDRYTNTQTNIRLNDTTEVAVTVSADPASYDVNRFGIVWNRSNQPIKFLNARATVNGNQVNLQWKTNHQLRVVSYEIIYSADGVRYAAAAQVPRRTANADQEYTFTHTPALNELVGYYRIKVLLNDGTSVMSDLIALAATQVNSQYQMYPNPSTGRTTNIRFETQPSGDYLIELLHTNGEVLAQKRVMHTTAGSVYSMALPAGLVSGVYRVRISGNHAPSTLLTLFIQQ